MLSLQKDTAETILLFRMLLYALLRRKVSERRLEKAQKRVQISNNALHLF